MTGVFLHIYYPHLYVDLITRLKRAPFSFNLYVNLVNGVSDMLEPMIKQEFPEAVVNCSPNTGMDPGGQLRTLHYWLQNGQDEEFIVFLHSKRDDSLRALMSSIVNDTKALLSFQDPEIGMVGVEQWNLYPGKMYGDPIDQCDYYCDLLKLNNFTTKKFGFCGGTMFWVRSSIFRKVFSGVDIISLVEELPAYDNGGRIHALERIFGYCVLSEGYKIKGI